MIYFLKRADGLVKIGFTGNYHKRFYQLQSEHGELEHLGWIEGDMPAEKEMYKFFAEYRVEGEWFKYSEFMEAYLKINAFPNKPERPPKPEVTHLTFDDYLSIKLDAAMKEEREKYAALLEQSARDRIEIVQLKAQLEMMEKLAVKLQDHAIETALSFLKDQKEQQIKRVS